MKFNIRLLYLYLFSFVGLLISVISAGQLINLGMKTFVFKDADVYEAYPMTGPEGKEIEDKEEALKRQRRDVTRQRQRDLSSSLSMLLVGVPLYVYHWDQIQKSKSE